MSDGLDRQVEFERVLMDSDADKHWRWGDDWYWGDDEIDSIRMREYRMYELDCYEVEVENID